MRDDRREIIIAWMPAERIAYTPARGHDARGGALSPRRVLDLEIDSRHTLDRFDHLTNGEAMAIAAIEPPPDCRRPRRWKKRQNGGCRCGPRIRSKHAN